MSIEYLEGDQLYLDRVQPLWEKLNQHHAQVSTYFSSHFQANSYENRKAVLLSEDRLALRIYIAHDDSVKRDVGYCVCTIFQDGSGEIDSLYVDADYRGKKIADTLMRKALNWLEVQSVKIIRLSVAFGNEQVFEFYRRYGFYPRLSVLMRK